MIDKSLKQPIYCDTQDSYFVQCVSPKFNKIQQQITKFRHLSSPELIKLLQEALNALQIKGIKVPLFTGTKYASYSLGYQLNNSSVNMGLVWTEEANMTNFFYVMEACKKAVKKDPSLTLFLIRAESLGEPKNKGHKLYLEIFTQSSHRHIKPNLASVHYLETYYSLVRDAREGDLVVGNQTLNLKSLQSLIRESHILDECLLLKQLNIVEGKVAPTPELPIKDFVLNLVTTQYLLGKNTLIQNAQSKFPTASESQIVASIQQLCQENKIKILDPEAKAEAQLICLVPKQSLIKQ
ncbi:hypothetical protein [Anabaena azotica]|uniref:Uncharacterized protein n=1 Tax=Anabaena azotica FACHB-119 TaxID=947527 RepID=A0ABR8DBC0_9NOST|nr:hypothetical protein [Anabaena azotica]MBD2504384.1 hypothetical protein [Anabaena azotica FACHB-119]